MSFAARRGSLHRFESLYDILQTLKEQHGFDLLVDVTCVDYLNYRNAKDRFGLVYLLANTETNERITVRCFVNDPEPTVPSVVGLWKGPIGWSARRGHVRHPLAGHPDLRRILLPEEFAAHPLRKDYPLQGRASGIISP